MARAHKGPRSLATPILVAVIIIIFIFTGGSLWGSVTRFQNTLYYTSIYSNQPAEGEIELHIIDIGQGDCALIRSAYGNILIDAGISEREYDLREHLNYCGIEKIDYFFCSHAHSDHIGGADMVVQNFKVENFILPRTEESNSMLERLIYYASAWGITPQYANMGDVYSLGEITITVLHAGDGTYITNDNSLVLKITFGEMDFLFTGDISENVEYTLLDIYGEDVLDCEFLKLAHHGSDTSSTKHFLDAVSPYMASASCAKGNDYGHPRGEVLRRLELAGCENILRTDKMGTCVVRANKDGIRFVLLHDIHG